MGLQQPSSSQISEALGTIPLFAGLAESALHQLAQVVRWHEYEAGQVVVLEGDERSALFYIQSGWVKVVKNTPNGREQTLRFLEPGETFNEVGVFADRPTPATVIALETAAIWRIPRSALLQLLEQYPAFGQHVIGKMAESLLYMVSLVTDISLRTVTSRLARLILDDAVEGVLQRPRWYTQAELAARLGTVPDVVQRSLRDLAQEGLILTERQEIRILDEKGLANIAGLP